MDECYFALKGMNLKDNLTEEEMNKAIQDCGDLININPEHLKLISEEEYLMNVEEDV